MVLFLMMLVYIIMDKVFSKPIEENAQELLLQRRQTISRSLRLGDFELLAKAERITEAASVRYKLSDAESYSLIDVLHREPSYERHLDAHNYLMVWQEKFKDEEADLRNIPVLHRDLVTMHAGIPELFFVVDNQGKGVARIGVNTYEWWGHDLAGGENSYSVLKQVESGKTLMDMWIWDGKLFHVAVAPIKDAWGSYLGAVVMGFPINQDISTRYADIIGDCKLMFFHNGEIYASSLSSSETKVVDNEFLKWLISREESEPKERKEISLSNENYLAIGGHFIGNVGNVKSGYILLLPMAKYQKPFSALGAGIPLVGIVILIIALVVVFMIIRNFLRPLEELDLGIQEILAGNKEYIFPVKPSHPFQAEMAYSLNLMSAYLQGKPLPDDDEEEGWDDFDFKPPTHKKKPVVKGISLGKALQPSAQAEKDNYNRALFEEYITARQKLGQSNENILFERFIEKLQKNENVLKARHGCKEVRFEVVLKEGKVVLKPKPIY